MLQNGIPFILLRFLLLVVLIASHTISSFASEPVLIDWVGSADSTYELQIIQNKKIILKKIVQGNSAEFPFNKLGTYLWRVREIKGDVKGEFSKLFEINIRDGVTTITEPLMTFPYPNSTVFHDKQSQIELKWKVPSDKYTYHLMILANDKEILNKKIAKPIGSLKLKINSQYKKIKWRVQAISPMGNTSPSEDFFEINVKSSKEDQEELNRMAQMGFFAFYSMTKISQIVTVDNTNSDKFEASESTSGYRFGLNYSFILEGFDKRFIVDTSLMEMSASSLKYSMTRREITVGGSYKFIANNSNSQSLGLGAIVSFNNLKFDDNFLISYADLSPMIIYKFEQIFNPKFIGSLFVNAFSTINDLGSLSYRVAMDLNYRSQRKMNWHFITGLEEINQKAAASFGGDAAESNFSASSVFFGVNLTFLISW
jgi:hypothetical protein